MADDILASTDNVADALDLSGAEISNLLNGAPLVARLPAIESSNGTTHKYINETGAPTVGWRAENTGREFDHSTDTVVTETLTIMDFSWGVDKAVADAWRRGGPEALIAREGARHLRAALYAYEVQLINGTVTQNGGSASGFAGLCDEATLDKTGDTMVTDAGGTTATTGSSVWLMNVGDLGVQAVYKGDGDPLELGETIVQDFCEADAHYPIYYTPACAWLGIQIGGAYTVGRICNLTEDAGCGLTDDLIYESLANFPADRNPNLIVMNRRSMRQLRDSRTATNATGAPAPRPTEVDGIPIIVTDAISNVEAIVAAS